MFTTVEEGVVVYKNMLRGYKEFVGGLRETFRNLGTREAIAKLNNNETPLSTLIKWNVGISAMEKVLGLSRDEIEAIKKEVGL